MAVADSRLFEPVDVMRGQMVLEPASVRITARDLMAGDWPISLAGWRPCSRVTRHRNGMVSVVIDGRRHKVEGSRSILVRRGR